MRLWHVSMISYLPKLQLLGQWRECCLIAALLATDHTPNHILVNPVMDYPPEHFELYCAMVYQEMTKRNMKPVDSTCRTLENNLRAWRIYLDAEVPWDCFLKDYCFVTDTIIFPEWHNQRYFRQCYYNIEEKYDRGGVPKDEWLKFFANAYEREVKKCI